MVVEKGYKQTEVGVMPENWNVSVIGNECKIFGRIGFRGYTVNDIVQEGKGAITLSPSNIQDDELDIKKVTYISWFKYEESPEIKIYNGDILLVKTGSTFGKTAFVKGLNEKATVNPQIVVLKNIKCDAQFLGYVMKSPIIQNQINSFIVGGAIPTLSQEQVKRFKIPLPPLPEQTAIANALSDMDALIAQTEKLIEKKKAIKQGVMQELLKPKEGWVTKKLGENASILRGGSPRPIEDYLTTASDGINWIKIGDVGKNAKYITSTEEKIIPDGMSRSRVVKPGDFLLSNSMSFGRPYIMQIDGCIHDGWLVITEYESNFDSDFLYYVLGSEAVFTQYKSMASGSSVLNLNKEIVKEVNVACPKNLDEQVHISRILSEIDIDLDYTELKLQKLKNLKQGMMQALLTGKIRLI